MYPKRKSPRLKGYDYSTQGAYFVTVCTYQRMHLFGEVVGGVMQCNAAGEIAYGYWQQIIDHYEDVDLDGFVVMPNHIHGIVVLQGSTGTFKTVLGRVINGYKGAITAKIRLVNPDIVVWQTRYHDHIIWDEQELKVIRGYIENNASKWAEDRFYGVG